MKQYLIKTISVVFVCFLFHVTNAQSVKPNPNTSSAHTETTILKNLQNSHSDTSFLLNLESDGVSILQKGNYNQADIYSITKSNELTILQTGNYNTIKKFGSNNLMDNATIIQGGNFLEIQIYNY